MRKWLAWELNWLRNHGFSIEKADLGHYGESPVEYITGRASWMGREVGVDENTLIPRVETEELVRLILGEIESKEEIEATSSVGDTLFAAQKRSADFSLELTAQVKNHSTLQKSNLTISSSQSHLYVAEVGTGSGAIAIGLMSELKKRRIKSKIMASDISPKVIEKARENAREWGIGREEIVFLESDLMQGFPPHKKFDLIIANLPYIPSKRIKKLEASVRDFEPKLALDGGADGAELITKCLGQARAYLAPKGRVWMEVDETHDRGIIEKYNLHREWKIEIIKDSWGKVRFWRAQKWSA